MAQGAGDVDGLDRTPAPVVAMVVVVHVDGLVRWSSCQFEASGDAPERFAWAEEGVVIRTVAHLFASDGILLVVEHEGGVADSLDGVQVIQRCLWGAVVHFVDGEVDVPEQKGLSPCFGRLRLGAFRGAEQPVVGDDAEVHSVLVEHSVAWVLEVEDVEQGLENGDVDGVGSGFGLVLFPQGGDEINT